MQVEFFKQSSINRPYEKAFLEAAKSLINGKSAIVNGNYISIFEREFAKFIGAKYCSFLSNGIDALSIALQTCDLVKGDEIIIPNHTYIASWLAALNLGLKIVAAPVKSNNFLIDEDRIEDLLTKKTKCIMPVHLYGNSVDMRKINYIASKYKLQIIDDAAQAHGSKLNGSRVGSFGNLSCFSFYPTKNLGALGEAGCITTNDKTKYERINSIRNYGKSSKNRSLNIFKGSNYRGDELQAAFLTEKLKNIHSIINKRKELLKIYEEEIISKGRIKIRLIEYDKESSPHLAIIVLPTLEIRDSLKSFLEKRGIQTLIHYPIPCHKQPFINNNQISISEETSYQADQISSTILSLPLSEAHTKKEFIYITSSINDFLLKK